MGEIKLTGKGLRPLFRAEAHQSHYSSTGWIWAVPVSWSRHFQQPSGMRAPRGLSTRLLCKEIANANSKVSVAWDLSLYSLVRLQDLIFDPPPVVAPVLGLGWDYGSKASQSFTGLPKAQSSRPNHHYRKVARLYAYDTGRKERSRTLANPSLGPCDRAVLNPLPVPAVLARVELLEPILVLFTIFLTALAIFTNHR